MGCSRATSLLKHHVSCQAERRPQAERRGPQGGRPVSSGCHDPGPCGAGRGEEVRNVRVWADFEGGADWVCPKLAVG